MFKTALVAGFILFCFVPATAEASGRQNNNTGFNSAYNHAQYWGENCKKFDSPNNKKTWDASNDEVSMVIVKGGTKVKIYEEGSFTGLTAELNERSGKPYDISHVIECYGEKQVEEEVCEYNSELFANDPDCRQNEVPGDNPKQDDPEVPVKPTNPESGSVLNETDDYQPEILAETGISPFGIVMVGLGFASVTGVITKLTQEEDEFLNTL